MTALDAGPSPSPPPSYWSSLASSGGWALCRRLALFLALTSTSALVWVGLGLYLHYAPTVPAFAHIDDYQPKLGCRIYSADQQLIAEFAQERRVLVSAEAMPPLLPKAFMAAEDKRFLQHSGLDLLGICQAMLGKLLRPSDKLRGASTITQQVAKSLLATNETYESATERTLQRKLREAILARHLEHVLTKEQILNIYLNQTFLGHKAYGVGAAAEAYFRRPLQELSIGQVAVLAGLPQRPSDYSPLSRPKAAQQRRAYVLRRMQEDGHITAAQAAAARQEPLSAYGREELYLQMAPHYAEQVRRALVDRFGERAVLEDGMEVYTAINLERQFHAQAAIERGLRALDKRQGFRGPIAHLDPGEKAAFVASYQAAHQQQISSYEGPATPQPLLAFVTGIGARGQSVAVEVGAVRGIIPLAAMRWARKPNPYERVQRHYLTDAREAVMAGDLIWVTPTTIAQLRDDPFAGELVDQVPSNVALFALEQEPVTEAALVSIAARSGYVEVQIGGANFEESSYNRALQACREPGSAFKPIVYSAGIDKYDYNASTQLDDKPIIFDDPTNQTRWKPNNAGEQFRGRLPMRTCIKDSINTPAVRVADAVGMEDVLKNARRLGIDSQLKHELGTALGSSCCTLMELMNVYTTLSQQGQRREPLFIRRIVDRFGNVLEDNSAADDPTLDWASRTERAWRQLVTPPRQVLEPATAFIMTSLLKNVVQSGTATAAASIGQIIAGKTGTTNDSYDAWFMGYTRSLVTGVWVGFDRNERPLGVGELGGRTALPIWVDMMDHALVEHTPSGPRRRIDGDFEVPAGVVQVSIDVDSGLLARPDSRRTAKEWYRLGTEPTQMAPDRAVIDPTEVDIFKADQGGEEGA